LGHDGFVRYSYSELAHEWAALRVFVRSCRDQNDVDDPPDAAATERNQFQDTKPDAAGIEAVHAQLPEQDREDQRHCPVVALGGNARLRLHLWRRWRIVRHGWWRIPWLSWHWGRRWWRK